MPWAIKKHKSSIHPAHVMYAALKQYPEKIKSWGLKQS